MKVRRAKSEAKTPMHVDEEVEINPRSGGATLHKIESELTAIDGVHGVGQAVPTEGARKGNNVVDISHSTKVVCTKVDIGRVTSRG